jgi:NAD(P)-dependent dehydrogenase (short-subunit alcohol dehydrogenase family)
MNIAIITGGSSGVGRSLALQLARRQYGVVLTYRSRAAEAEALIADIAGGGGTAVALALDVADMRGHEAFVARVREALRAKWQREDFDVLVNNAGVGGGMALAEVTEGYFDAMFATNFKGPFFLTQKLLPHLRDGGQIVNVSSSSVWGTSDGYSVYAATKAALTTATRYWAKELAPRKIRVNSVSPGPIHTSFGLLQGDGQVNRQAGLAHHPEYLGPLGSQHLLGRVAEPDDIGEAIAALISDSCRFITATDLDVSGGFMV